MAEDKKIVQQHRTVPTSKSEVDFHSGEAFSKYMIKAMLCIFNNKNFGLKLIVL